MATVPIYLNVNSDNGTILEAPAIEKKDKWTEIYLTEEGSEYLQRYWKNYTIRDGMAIRQVKNLLDLSRDHLLHQNEILGSRLDAALSTIEDLKTSNAALGGAQAQTTVDVQNVKGAVEEVKTATSELGGQFAEMLVSQTPAATE